MTESNLQIISDGHSGASSAATFSLAEAPLFFSSPAKKKAAGL